MIVCNLKAVRTTLNDVAGYKIGPLFVWNRKVNVAPLYAKQRTWCIVHYAANIPLDRKLGFSTKTEAVSWCQDFLKKDDRAEYLETWEDSPEWRAGFDEKFSHVLQEIREFIASQAGRGSSR